MALWLKRIRTGPPTGVSSSFDPQTKLLYVNAQRGFTIFYLDLNANNQVEGHQGGAATPLWSDNALVAIDFATGKIRWSRTENEGRSHPGILTTAGGVLFTGDASGNLLALDAENGHVLWHKYPGGFLDSSPMTYQLDGRQFVLTAVGDVLYAWALP